MQLCQNSIGMCWRLYVSYISAHSTRTLSCYLLRFCWVAVAVGELFSDKGKYPYIIYSFHVEDKLCVITSSSWDRVRNSSQSVSGFCGFLKCYSFCWLTSCRHCEVLVSLIFLIYKALKKSEYETERRQCEVLNWLSKGAWNYWCGWK